MLHEDPVSVVGGYATGVCPGDSGGRVYVQDGGVGLPGTVAPSSGFHVCSPDPSTPLDLYVWRGSPGSGGVGLLPRLGLGGWWAVEYRLTVEGPITVQVPIPTHPLDTVGLWSSPRVYVS